jgi:NAD(P)-dependent dehydrogenase (short-subunit alcohol dehydrogenase family)
MKNDKKIAVITGSAGGLGKEFVQRLLRSGRPQIPTDLLTKLRITS